VERFQFLENRFGKFFHVDIQCLDLLMLQMREGDEVIDRCSILSELEMDDFQKVLLCIEMICIFPGSDGRISDRQQRSPEVVRDRIGKGFPFFVRRFQFDGPALQILIQLSIFSSPP
jgi:hypothetical protein